MANDPNLRVRISADLADIKQGLGLLRGELAKVKQQSAQAFSANSPNALVAGLRRLRTEVVGLVGAYASLAGAKMLAGVADEATRVRGRIREAKGDYEAILALAQRTRTGLTSTVDIYARLERSTRGRIKDSQQLLGLTESINQAVKLSFTSQAAGDAALNQLGQALASGVLRGEELNSVMEQTPRLAQAIADGLNVPRDRLRALAKEGKLTTDAVIKALQSQATVLSDEYARMPLTIRDAFTQIRNSFVDYVGKADAATGASKAFAQALQDIAKDLPRYLDPLLTAVKLLLQNLDALAVLVGTRLALAAIPAMITAVKGLQAAFVALRGATIAWSTVAAALGGPVGLALAAVATALYLVYQRTNQAKQAEDQHRKVMEEIEGQAQKNIVAGYQMAESKRQETRRTLELARSELELAKARFAAENTSVTARGGDRGDAAAFASTNNLNKQQAKVAQLARQEAELTAKLQELEQGLRDASIQPVTAPTPAAGTETPAAKAIAASNALQRDAVSRAIAEVERLYKASEIGTREYFATLTQLQQQAIDLQIQQARNELAVATDKGQRLKLEEEITILQRDRAEVSQRNARDEQQAQDAMIDKLGEVKAQLADLDGDAGRAARIRIEAQYAELFKQLERDSDETGKAMVRNLVDRLVDKAKLDAVRSRVGEVTGALSSREQSISTQMEAGTLGRGEGERQLQAVRQKTLDQLRQERDLQWKVLGDLSEGSPLHAQALQGLDEINSAIAGITASMDTFGRDVEAGAFSSLSALFRSIREQGTLTIDALRGAVADFAASIYDSITGDWAKNIASTVRGWFGSFLGKGAEAAAETTAATAAATIQTTAAATSSATITAGATAASAALTTGAVTGATALTTAGAAVATSIVTAAIQAAAILQAQASASAATSALSLASAKGNAFDLSGLRAFARGAAFPAIAAFAAGGAFTNQVVASPTLFAFGKGGQLGVMGEAGPEAIMPLERGPGGRLGVRNNSGAAAPAPAKVVVVFGEAELANALAGSAGEAVTVAHVRNNWGALNGGG